MSNFFKVHFSVIISPNFRMQQEVELLIHSICTVGKCPNSFFTIFTENPNDIHSSYIKSRGEVVGYLPDEKLKYSWSTCPRWSLNPRADLIIAIDSDVVAWKDLNPLIEELYAEDGICGTLACKNTTSLDEWKQLFNQAKITWPDQLFTDASGDVGPYYINNGVISTKHLNLRTLNNATRSMLSIVNENYYDDYYITQKATTLAIYHTELTKKIMPISFNHLESCYGQPTENTYFFHYNGSRDKKNKMIELKFNCKLM